MPEGLTKSEKFVTNISKRAFLTLWTHPNPVGKNGKELCDCLIVCGNHIVIISVKDIAYKDTGDITGYNRWIKAAIDESASQIWGAERWLKSVQSFARRDERLVDLPPLENRLIHRISVSLGAKRQILTKSGDLGNGIVHVCDEISLGAIFGLLDTITDFVEFFSEIEALLSRANVIFSGGGIEDLLAIYLQNNYSFPFGEADHLMIDDTMFKGFVDSDFYKAQKQSFQSSYLWDDMIEHFTKYILTGGMFDYSTKEPTQNQLALIQMAIQPREHRANLLESFKEFLEKPELKIASRVVLAYQNTAFVFLVGDSTDREARVQELGARCLVIRGRLPDVGVVVGIARDRPSESTGHSSDLVYIDIPVWTDELECQVHNIQKELGYFKNADWNRILGNA